MSNYNDLSLTNIEENILVWVNKKKWVEELWKESEKVSDKVGSLKVFDEYFSKWLTEINEKKWWEDLINSLFSRLNNSNAGVDYMNFYNIIVWFYWIIEKDENNNGKWIFDKIDILELSGVPEIEKRLDLINNNYNLFEKLGKKQIEWKYETLYYVINNLSKEENINKLDLLIEESGDLFKNISISNVYNILLTDSEVIKLLWIKFLLKIKWEDFKKIYSIDTDKIEKYKNLEEKIIKNNSVILDNEKKVILETIGINISLVKGKGSKKDSIDIIIGDEKRYKDEKISYNSLNQKVKKKFSLYSIIDLYEVNWHSKEVLNFLRRFKIIEDDLWPDYILKYDLEYFKENIEDIAEKCKKSLEKKEKNELLDELYSDEKVVLLWWRDKILLLNKDLIKKIWILNLELLNYLWVKYENNNMLNISYIENNDIDENKLTTLNKINIEKLKLLNFDDKSELFKLNEIQVNFLNIIPDNKVEFCNKDIFFVTKEILEELNIFEKKWEIPEEELNTLLNKINWNEEKKDESWKINKKNVKIIFDSIEEQFDENIPDSFFEWLEKDFLQKLGNLQAFKVVIITNYLLDNNSELSNLDNDDLKEIQELSNKKGILEYLEDII